MAGTPGFGNPDFAPPYTVPGGGGAKVDRRPSGMPSGVSRGYGRGTGGGQTKRTPYDSLLEFINGAGYYEAGSGGSPGNGAAIRALVARLNANKDTAANRYATNNTQVTDIYGQLRDAIEPNQMYTQQRYDKAINASNQGGGQIAERVQQMQQQSGQKRDQALSSLGIDTGLAQEEESAAQAGLADLAQTNSTWGNMMGVLSNAQQSRDRLDLQGAVDAGTLAKKELLNNYEDYLRAIDGQIAEAWGQYRPGSGGTPGRYVNPYLEQLQNVQFQSLMQQAGLGGGDGSDWGGLAGFAASLGQSGGLNQLGKGMSDAELLSLALQNSQNPQQVQTLLGLFQ